MPLSELEYDSEWVWAKVFATKSGTELSKFLRSLQPTFAYQLCCVCAVW